MYNDPQPEQDEQTTEANGGIRSHFHRLMDKLTGNRTHEEEYVEEEEEVAVATATTNRPSNTNGAAMRGNTYRIASMRESSITVSPVGSFADIQKAADRLKEGEPQIINLEKTSPEIAERLIDFLNGVTYALDGSVEKIAEGAYLFTPATMKIHTDGPDMQPKSYFDKL